MLAPYKGRVFDPSSLTFGYNQVPLRVSIWRDFVPSRGAAQATRAAASRFKWRAGAEPSTFVFLSVARLKTIRLRAALQPRELVVVIAPPF